METETLKTVEEVWEQVKACDDLLIAIFKMIKGAPRDVRSLVALRSRFVDVVEETALNLYQVEIEIHRIREELSRIIDQCDDITILELLTREDTGEASYYVKEIGPDFLSGRFGYGFGIRVPERLTRKAILIEEKARDA